ncbi:MAG: hypothetical protein ACK55Z_19290, partial [bacterium]
PCTMKVWFKYEFANMFCLNIIHHQRVLQLLRSIFIIFPFWLIDIHPSRALIILIALLSQVPGLQVSPASLLGNQT